MKAGADDGIELLDVEPISVVSVDHVETASGKGVGAVIAAAVAIVAAVLVIGVENGSSPPVERPVDDAPAEVELPLTERAELEAQFGVAIGDGPGLTWQLVDVETNARHWRWNNGRFVRDDGATQWGIELAASGPAVSEQASALIAHPGHSFARLEGGELLVPDGPDPDHLLVIANASDAVRLDLPQLTNPQPSELTEANVWFYGAIIGDRLVIHRSVYTEVDIAVLEARSGRDLTGIAHIGVNGNQIDLYPSGPEPMLDPIPIADAGLTEAEIDDLRNVGQPFGDVLSADLVTGDVERVDFAGFEYNNDLLIGLDGELLVGWTDTGGRGWLSSTFDGVQWSTEPRGVARWLVNSGTQLFDFNSQGASIARSGDGGQTWNLTPVPLEDTLRTVAGDVVVLGDPWWRSSEIGGVLVDTDSNRYTLSLFDNGDRFELRGPSPFSEVMAGWTYDPASGAVWDGPTNTLVFSDPRTGDRLTSVRGHAIDSALALQHPMEQMALARWPTGLNNPEWLITSPTEVFGEGALTVDFISGDQYLLAIVTTVDGYVLYIADTELS